MKCSNSAFNAQGSRVIMVVVQLGEHCSRVVMVVVVQVGALKIYVSTSAGAEEKRKHRMKLSLPPKLVEKN
jgi:hypothetical protein